MKLVMSFILFFVFVYSTISNASEVFEFYNGVRALGMGGVQVAVVNDETALVANPAALGRLRDYFVTVADPEIEYGSDTNTLIGLDIMAGVAPQRALNALNAKPTLRLSERVQVFPSLVLPNFGVGLLGKYRMTGDISGTNFNADYVNDFAAIVGFNFRLLDGRVKLGFNTKVINRSEVKGVFPTSSTNLSVVNNGKEGLGLGVDIGLIFTAPWKTLPTLAIVARDFGDTKFSNGGVFNTTSLRPDTINQSYDIGVAISPILGKRTRSTFSFEIKDALNISAYDDAAKLYHFGGEFNFFDAIFLRFGANQRYWTAGLEFAVKNYQLQIASYGEEIGTDVAPVEDRRYVLKFAYRF